MYNVILVVYKYIFIILHHIIREFKPLVVIIRAGRNNMQKKKDTRRLPGCNDT